jgi:hypothetical protein
MLSPCQLVSNSAASTVGGVDFVRHNEDMVIQHSEFIDNYGHSNTGALRFYDENYNIEVVHCLFRGNMANFDGGAGIALFFSNRGVQILNCVFESNIVIVGRYALSFICIIIIVK